MKRRLREDRGGGEVFKVVAVCGPHSWPNGLLAET